MRNLFFGRPRVWPLAQHCAGLQLVKLAIHGLQAAGRVAILAPHAVQLQDQADNGGDLAGQGHRRGQRPESGRSATIDQPSKAAPQAKAMVPSDRAVQVIAARSLLPRAGCGYRGARRDGSPVPPGSPQDVGYGSFPLRGAPCGGARPAERGPRHRPACAVLPQGPFRPGRRPACGPRVGPSAVAPRPIPSRRTPAAARPRRRGRARAAGPPPVPCPSVERSRDRGISLPPRRERPAKIVRSGRSASCSKNRQSNWQTVPIRQSLLSTRTGMEKWWV